MHAGGGFIVIILIENTDKKYRRHDHTVEAKGKLLVSLEATKGSCFTGKTR